LRGDSAIRGGTSMASRRIGKKAVEYQYDFCLSFAGEDRSYVRDVAERLKFLGVRVFMMNIKKPLSGGRIYTTT
jgi:hypothetical protein